MGIESILKSILVDGRKITFGRKAPSAEALARVPKFSAYKTELAAVPAAADYSVDALPCLSRVMLNDQLGDCTCAGAAHALGIWTGNAGNLFTMTDDQVLAMYEAVGGYNPADPSTDQGADEVSVLNYLVQTGFPDGSKLAGYVAIDGTNQAEVQQACYLFESLYFGVGLPDGWINPFPSADGFTWDAAPADPANGHCFVATGYDQTGVQIDTWGLLGTVTYAGVAALTAASSDGQLYALLSPDSISRASGKAASGFDFATLQADLDAMNTAIRGGLSA